VSCEGIQKYGKGSKTGQWAANVQIEGRTKDHFMENVVLLDL